MESIKRILDKIIEVFCIVIMAVMTLLVTWQVFTRYILNSPSAITEQLSQYLFVWLILYAAAYVFGKREHMKITFIREKISEELGIIFDVSQEIIIAIFALSIMTYGGLISTLKQMDQMDASLQIPIGVVYSAIPISGIFIVFYSIYNLINIVKKK